MVNSFFRWMDVAWEGEFQEHHVSSPSNALMGQHASVDTVHVPLPLIYCLGLSSVLAFLHNSLVSQTKNFYVSPRSPISSVVDCRCHWDTATKLRAVPSWVSSPDAIRRAHHARGPCLFRDHRVVTSWNHARTALTKNFHYINLTLTITISFFALVGDCVRSRALFSSRWYEEVTRLRRSTMLNWSLCRPWNLVLGPDGTSCWWQWHWSFVRI